MEFNNTECFNFDGAIRGMRNPLESWDKSDSYFSDFKNDGKCGFVLGKNDLELMQRLLDASIKEGNSHSKFMRQILVCVDITAPLYWWKEFDTYKVGTVANSTSTMHKLVSTPITIDYFETDDYDQNLIIREEEEIDCWGKISTDKISLKEDVEHIVFICERLRRKYLETKDKRYWKELIRWLPESWLQTRTVTLNYQVLRQMYFDRRHHKLTEWSEAFINWVKTLPYAEKLIMYEGKAKRKETSMISYNLNSIEKAKKLVSICEKYKEDFYIDVVYGRQVIDATSILGVISLIGHIVSIHTSYCNERYNEFKKEIEEVESHG